MAEQLKRGFGYWTVLALVFGSVFGTTIFFGIPIAAGYSGNLIIVAWIVLSAIAVYMAAIFGELAATFPKAGGAYEFSKKAYGKFLSFVMAWIAWLVGSLSTVVIIIAAVNSLNLGISQFTSFLLGVALIVLLNIISFTGVKASSVFLIAIAALTIALPALIIAKGLPAASLLNLQPVASHELKTVLIALFFMAEAYFGWEAVTYLAEETKNPEKNIPKALVRATLATAVIGLLLITVMLGIIPWQEIAKTTSPVLELASSLYGQTTKAFFSAGIFIIMIGTAAATIISMPRLLLSLARDRLFLGQFRKLHPTFKTPHNAIMFQTVMLVMLLLLGLANYRSLLSLLVPMASVMYIALILSAVVLRRKYPDIERPFKVPFLTAGAIATIIFFLAITAGWALTVSGAAGFIQMTLSLIALGIPLYLLVELYYDPQMITQVNDLLAYATLFAQKIFRTGKATRERIVSFLGEWAKGKTILEYGGGLGSLTLDLLKAVGPEGTVNTMHFAKNYAKITSKRIEVKKWETEQWVYGQANVMHDPEQLKRLHPSVGYADAVVSVGILAYIQDIEGILAGIYRIMPVGGKIVFAENTDFFHILPNVEWLGNTGEIEKIFRNAGFSVRVTKAKGLLWNTLYIYGIKFKGTVPYI